MLSPSAENMSDSDMITWNAYRAQRIKEITHRDKSATIDVITKIAWTEYINLKWGESVKSKSPAKNGIEYALRMYDFGPDLNGIESTFAKNGFK